MQSSDRPFLICNFQSFFGTAILSHVGTCLQLTMGVEFDGISCGDSILHYKTKDIYGENIFEYEYVVQV